MKRDLDIVRRFVMLLDGRTNPIDKAEFHLLLSKEGNLIQLTDEGKEFAILCSDDEKWKQAKEIIDARGLGESYWLMCKVLESCQTESSPQRATK